MWVKYYLGYGNLLVAIGSFIIGSLAISKNWRDPVKRAFFIFTMAVGLYALFYWPMMLSKSFQSWKFYFEIMALPVAFIAISNVHFVFEWLGIAKNYRLFLICSYIFSIISLPVTFTPFFKFAPVQTWWGWPYTAGPFFYIWMGSYILFWNIAFFTLIKWYGRLNHIQKKQATLFFIGNIIGAMSGLPNFLCLGGITPKFPPLTSPFILFYVIINAYAIIRYRAMEIDTVIHRTTLWLLSILFLVAPVGILYGFFKNEISAFSHSAVALLVSLTLLLFLWYYHRLKPRIDHFFRRRKYDYQVILADLPARVGTSLDLEVLSKGLFKELHDILYIRNGLLLVKPPDKDVFDEAASIGYDILAKQGIAKPQKIVLPPDDSIIFWMNLNQKVLEGTQVEIDPSYVAVKERALSFCNDYSLELLIPLIANNQLISILGLGKKENLQPYALSDIELLERLGKQIGISIDNALHHGDIVEKERLAEELRLGRQIQMMLLPQESPRIAGLTVEGMMEPAKEIGGDYYDFISLPNRDSLSIVIGDVSGKGVAAGLLMAMAKTAIHTLSQEENSPKQILLRANNILNQHIGGQKFMTMLYFMWQAQTKTLTYSSAGHEHILIYRSQTQQLEAIQSGGLMLGMIPDIERFLEEKEINLQPRDKILLYTDGVTEALNQNQERFGLNRLKEVFQKYNDKPTQELMKIIKDEMYSFIGDTPQYDDITLVVMEAN